MLSTKMPLILKPELDAFLATALSPELGNSDYLSDIAVERLSPRGIHLATLFMEVMCDRYSLRSAHNAQKLILTLIQ